MQALKGFSPLRAEALVFCDGERLTRTIYYNENLDLVAYVHGQWVSVEPVTKYNYPTIGQLRHCYEVV